MKVKSFLRATVIGVVASASFSQASAQQVTVSIASSGNINHKGVVQAWCLNSGKTCKVIGNRPHHPGPRSCAMSCNVGDIAVFSCETNNDDRYIDEIYGVPASASEVNDNYMRDIHSWVVSASSHTSCAFTD